MSSRRILLVASTGGHLTQLLDLADRIPGSEDALWVTFDADQSRSALADRRHEFVPYVAPRGYLALLRVLPRAIRHLRAERPEVVVSTGSGIALPYLPIARLFGARAVYVESATRAEGPSFTGGLLARLPWITLHTQHPHQQVDRWTHVGSVFDGFGAEPVEPPPIRRVVVTVGTMQTYGFRRLLERVRAILPSDAEVLWQTGVTDIDGLEIDGRASVPSDELMGAMRDADVVIAHAGTGTALSALQQGKRPVLVPRSTAHGEHVDDHQQQTASYLAGLGLAEATDVDDLTLESLERAASARVVRLEQPPQLPI